MSLTDVTGNSFNIKEYISSGSFSKVYKLQCCETGKHFAGKFINKQKLQKCGIFNKVWDEVKIHQRLRHRNIVQFTSFIEQERNIVIILEYCSRYSMANVLHSLKTLTLNEAKYFMIQVVSAVQYLHRMRIVHRDLKLGNLFLNKQMVIKLGDFGLAVVLDYEGQKRFSRCGTPNYIAPEVISGVGHSYQVDVWALGCILYTMLEGTPPFQAENSTSTYNNILRCKYNISPQIIKSAKTLIQSTLQPEPSFRPTVFDLTDFEFFTSANIIPKVPEFTFDVEEVPSPSKKRIVTRVSNIKPHPLKDPNSKKCFSNCFHKISHNLMNVDQWPTVDMMEFYAEGPIGVRPLVWINSWVDYSNSYGFAYQMSNNNIGILFNDGTRMFYQPEVRSVKYVQTDGSMIMFNLESVPSSKSIQKKLNILLTCGDFMGKTLVNAYEAKNTGSPLDVEVVDWTRDGSVVVMFLSNGSVQLNCLRDHVKIILCGYTDTVTAIEENGVMKTMKLYILQKWGCRESLKQKLTTALYKINDYLKKELLY